MWKQKDHYGGYMVENMEKYEKNMYKWWIHQDFHIFSLDPLRGI